MIDIIKAGIKFLRFEIKTVFYLVIKVLNVFDFFRNIYAELSGLDPVKMDEEKSMRKKNLTLARAVKIVIRIVGILYMLFAAISIISILADGINVKLIKYILAVIIDVVVLIFTFGKSRQSEIIVTVGVILFIGINFLMQAL